MLEHSHQWCTFPNCRMLEILTCTISTGRAHQQVHNARVLCCIACLHLSRTNCFECTVSNYAIYLLTGVRGIVFPVDGSCLLAATQDGLTCWGWEPVRRLDTVDVPWAKVSASSHWHASAMNAYNPGSQVKQLLPYTKSCLTVLHSMAPGSCL